MSQQAIISSDLNEARALEERMLEEVYQKGFTEAEVFAIKLALEEGFVNAIKHGNKHDASKKVSVTWDVTDERAKFTIADDGDGFQPEAVPDPTADENIERPCGRGLMLMHAYMDNVSYNTRGNQLRMVKEKAV